VLVVEDEEAVRRLAISVLERQGYKVLSAEGPMNAEAILVEYEGSIDLLLTDVVMPGGNGADLAARATALRPNLRVLMMSGYAQDALLERSPSEVLASLIEKPFTPDVLVARVRVALDSRPGGAGTEFAATPAGDLRDDAGAGSVGGEAGT
jgi:DNA-binding NtrC family response regulator